MVEKGDLIEDSVSVDTAVHMDTYGDNNWKDKLTAYNGVSITYDAIGNPLNDGTWTYTWAKGRQLQSMSRGSETVSFVYNEDGLRTRKTSSTTGVTEYILHGKNIVHLKNGSDELHFFYDAQNKPSIVMYNGNVYAYLYSLQGDVIALVDSVGNIVVEYQYDAWGKIIGKTGMLAETLGMVQPFRYRGYVYDEETGLYYLRSRYYRAEWCSFVNADALIQSNLFTYCSNNTINSYDADGYMQITNVAAYTS